LVVSGSTLTAPAFPPVGGFKNLSIKVASNTTVTVAADYVVTTNGSGSFQTTAVSSTVNLGTTGVNALIGGAGANGTIAIDTWYHLWVIVQANGTTRVVACTSSTADSTFLTALGNLTLGSPALGFPYYARVGAVLTIHGSATLYGTWQLGRQAQYVVGLAQTSIVPNIANSAGGAVGTFSTTSPTLAAVSITGVVPPTAAQIKINVANNYGGHGLGSVIVAPTTAWGGSNRGPEGSVGNPYPVYLAPGGGINTQVNIMLETTTIAWATSGTGGGISCLGWEDNI
jgi:hypothetical protein